jgi:hypothetical protein
MKQEYYCDDKRFTKNTAPGKTSWFDTAMDNTLGTDTLKERLHHKYNVDLYNQEDPTRPQYTNHPTKPGLPAKAQTQASDFFDSVRYFHVDQAYLATPKIPKNDPKYAWKRPHLAAHVDLATWYFDFSN